MQDLTEKTAPQEIPFDALRLTKEDGSEFWSARDLQGALGYVQWRRFHDVILRAKASARNSGVSGLDDQFAGAGKLIEHGNGGLREVEDFRLSRYAAYLVAMNGDPNKHEIAAAQHYFAVRTREAELGDKPKEVAYESLEVPQLREMAQASRMKASALDELATILLKIKAADKRYAEALAGELALEFRPEMEGSAGLASRTELAVRYLVPDNLRKSVDGQHWVVSFLDICQFAWGIPVASATIKDHGDAQRTLTLLGWESFRSNNLPYHRKRV